MEEILCYDGTDICYNGVCAVHDARFSLRSGEILGIAGESGSGKSTLIKAAMGLLGPAGLVTRGDIRYKGKSLLALSREERRTINGAEIAMIFQNAGGSFCPVRTLGSQLFEAYAEHGGSSRDAFFRRAVEVLRKLRFPDAERILGSYPFELSGGMQQRAGIAAAMLSEPAVLLADEPTSALDVSVQKQVVEEMLLVRELYGTAIVIVTHNIGVLRKMADRVIVMKGGEIVEAGETRTVLEQPRQAYTKALMAAVPKLKR